MQKDRKRRVIAIFLMTTALMVHLLKDLIKTEAKTASLALLPRKSKTCWQRLYEDNLRTEGPFELARTTMCAFSPKNPEKEAKLEKKNFTIVLIGVHAGPPTDGKVNVPTAGYKFISMERRDHHYPDSVAALLASQYIPKSVASLQREFWKMFKDNPDVKEADAIACGFDTWHCLLFAPFNKKMIFNSAYRFDGHYVVQNKELSAPLQRELDKMVRNNPDVVMAGTNLYDVMYHQHFFGSHKLIPLPAVGEYVRIRAKTEIEGGKCAGMKWNSESDVILIGPRRFSAGGGKILKRLLAKLKYLTINRYEQPPKTMKFVQLKGYNYCDFLKYRAVILFPYSIHSYTMVEIANLAVPIFIPSIKFMAQLEKDLHLLQERKSFLKQANINVMKPNTRSLNYGSSPNDDYNTTNIKQWLYYTDFSYWEGTLFFDSFEDLIRKINTVNFKKTQNVLEQHRLKNMNTNKDNWQSVVRYLSDGPKNEMPKTFEEGMALWNKKISVPKFPQLFSNTSANNQLTHLEYNWAITSSFTLNSISKLDSKCSVLYVASSKTDAIEFEKLKKKFEGRMIKVLLLDNHNLIKYRISTRENLDVYSKGILLGSLHLISNGATSIQVPARNAEGENSQQVSTSLYSKDRNLSPRRPSLTTYSYLDVWAGVWSASSSSRIFHQYSMSLWLQRLSWFAYGEPKVKQLRKLKENELTGLSSEQKHILRELQAYLQYWKTEHQTEIPNRTFFHIIDQLSFEMAVQGFMRKSDAEIIRDYLLDLVAAGYRIPKLKELFLD